jgi:hypothetical protein
VTVQRAPQRAQHSARRARSLTGSILIAAAMVGTAIAAGCAWMLITRIDPIGGPDWAFTIITASMTVAPVLAVLAGLSLLRGYEARRIAMTAFAVNTLGFVLGGAALAGIRALAQ